MKIGTSRSHPHFLWIIFKIHNNILGLWGHQYLGWLSIWIWPLLLASAEGQNLRLTMLPWSFAKSQTAWIYFKISSFYSLDKPKISASSAPVIWMKKIKYTILVCNVSRSWGQRSDIKVLLWKQTDVILSVCNKSIIKHQSFSIVIALRGGVPLSDSSSFLSFPVHRFFIERHI